MAIHFKRNTTIPTDLLLQLRYDEEHGPEFTELRVTHLPAEWYPQCAVQLTWPHPETDWAPVLKEVTRCYIQMAMQIASREKLLIVTPEPEQVKALLTEQLPQQVCQQIMYCQMPTNDTWARDHGFITLLDEKGIRLLDFKFNGWGEKFPAELDNQINRNLVQQGIFNGEYEEHLDFVLEGGSIESDGRGTILTTSQCLLAPHRNQPLTQADIEKRLLSFLHAERILWLDHGYLAGDDTDSHIDTLARFCPNDTIVYVKCDNPDDIHYEALNQMEQQLKEFCTVEGKPFRLLALPLPAPILESDFPDAVVEEGDQRLPATYANFLIINGAVLYPTYNQPENDQRAAEVLRKAFPDREIVGIDCRVLIRQHGSLHCVTMQYPK
jgi:agmatine/peptidylarginine deiminase